MFSGVEVKPVTLARAIAVPLPVDRGRQRDFDNGPAHPGNSGIGFQSRQSRSGPDSPSNAPTTFIQNGLAGSTNLTRIPSWSRFRTQRIHRDG